MPKKTRPPAFIPCTLREFSPPTPATTVARIGVLQSVYWGPGGVNLAVGFMDSPPADLQARILRHFNAWGELANIRFSASALGSAHVRVARTPGSGHWCYLGNQCLRVSRNEPTMNLDSFTMQTPDSEFYRVVRHEVGHLLGAPHEHMRKVIVDRLDPARTIAYFRQTQGWDEATTRQQVLTPVEETSLLRPTAPEDTSIMCYQLPGSITRDGRPITGGMNITPSDMAYMAGIYPLAVTPPPTNSDEWQFTVRVNEKTNTAIIIK